MISPGKIYLNHLITPTALKLYSQVAPKTYVIQMWCTNCRDNVLNFEFVFVPKSPSYTTYEKGTTGQ